jgi:hypothetical protein
MTSRRPDHQWITTHPSGGEAAMETFTMQLPRWPIARLWDRNPLVRISDRVEALVLVLAVLVSLLALPVTAAIGTAVYDSRRDVYVQETKTRHTVTATVTDDGAQHPPQATTITVQARWSAAGAQHTGAVTAPPTVKTGDIIEIWVDKNGSSVDAPTPTARAAAEAVTTAVTVWVSVAAAAATLFAGSRIVCDRIRTIGGNTISSIWPGTATDAPTATPKHPPHQRITSPV